MDTWDVDEWWNGVPDECWLSAQFKRGKHHAQIDDGRGNVIANGYGDSLSEAIIEACKEALR